MASPLIKVIQSEVEAAAQRESVWNEAKLFDAVTKPIPRDVQNDVTQASGVGAGSPLHAVVVEDDTHGTARLTNETLLPGPR